MRHVKRRSSPVVKVLVPSTVSLQIVLLHFPFFLTAHCSYMRINSQRWLFARSHRSKTATHTVDARSCVTATLTRVLASPRAESNQLHAILPRPRQGQPAGVPRVHASMEPPMVQARVGPHPPPPVSPHHPLPLVSHAHFLSRFPNSAPTVLAEWSCGVPELWKIEPSGRRGCRVCPGARRVAIVCSGDISGFGGECWRGSSTLMTQLPRSSACSAGIWDARTQTTPATRCGGVDGVGCQDGGDGGDDGNGDGAGDMVVVVVGCERCCVICRCDAGCVCVFGILWRKDAAQTAKML